MRLRTAIHRSANATVRAWGSLLQLPALPARFHRRWVKVPRAMWSDVQMTYEPTVAAVLEERLAAGACFVDVGAHQGLWSLYAANLVGRLGFVRSIEPSPAFAKLELVSRLYPVIRPIRCALGANRGEATFYSQGASMSASMVESVTEITRDNLPGVPIQPLTVLVRTLDDIVAEIGRIPSLVKVDTEGYELEVLRGATETLAKRVPMVIEVHPPQLRLSGGAETELTNLLQQHGYTIEVIDRNPNTLYTVFAR